MRTGWARLVVVAGLAGLLVACTSSPPVSRHTPAASPVATAQPTPPPARVPSPTPATGPVLATLTTADLATMASIYISYMNSGGGHSSFAPGSVVADKSYAARMPDGGEWAYVTFTLTSTGTEQNGVDMQEGARGAVYLRVTPDSTWLLRGLTQQGPCYAMPQIGVPVAVRSLWSLCPQ